MNLDNILLIGAALILGAGVLKKSEGETTPTPPPLVTTIEEIMNKAGAYFGGGATVGEQAGFGLAFGTPNEQTGIVTVTPEGGVHISNAATAGTSVLPIGVNEVGLGTSFAEVTPLGSVVTTFSQGGFTDLGERLTEPQLDQYIEQVKGEVADSGTRTTTARLSETGALEFVGTAGAVAEQIQAAADAGNYDLAEEIYQASKAGIPIAVPVAPSVGTVAPPPAPIAARTTTYYGSTSTRSTSTTTSPTSTTGTRLSSPTTSTRAGYVTITRASGAVEYQKIGT